MPAKIESLLGTWEKITVAPCCEPYPDRITFYQTGIYVATKDPPGTFSVWDSGKFEIAGDQEIKISTANDALITYRVTIADGLIHFVDSDACAFSYRRAE